MYGKTDPQQQWSVHAEFTISHPRVGDPENLPQTHTEQGDNGVRMTYTWTSQANQNAWSSRSTPPPSGSTISNRSTHSDNSKSYGFQRGNLLFTTTPPRRPHNFTEVNTNTATTNRLGGVQDSGYGSDLLSPNSLGSCLLQRRPVQPYNRKCRSTCNIVLSTNIQDENRTEDKAEPVHTQCGRTQSLRCQTPTLRCDRKDNFYGCGDPWCHHLHYGDDFSCPGRFSPVMEICEDCPSSETTSTKPSRTNTFSTTRCSDHNKSSLSRENENRKDACVQTFEMIDKCTSPFVKMGSFNFGRSDDKKDKAVKKKYATTNRRRTEPIFQRSHSPSSITPDSLDNLKVPRRLVRSPKLGKFTSTENTSLKEKNSPTESKLSDSSKKPRTVHIDVYCTGTEMESNASNSSSDSSDNETASTPQTVFESEKLRITHKRADENELPFNVRKSRSRSREKKLQGKRDEESDNDEVASTAYPSKISSYSTIRDFSSSISSVPQSWTTYSMSSCTVPDDYDSIANTSWKDTFSDIDSLLHSRSSIAQTDSLDFIPRKVFDKNPSIDETPEITDRKDLLETPSRESIQPSDSFEYANSEDRLRIKRMEEFWKNKTHPKHWKSPSLERRYLLQQKKIKEYLEKRLSDRNLPKFESKESDSEGSDESEEGWTFVKHEEKKGERTVESSNVVTPVTPRQSQSIGGSSSSGKSPSTVAIQQRLKMDPTLRAPFTIVPGIYTNQRAIAKKFGSIVPVVRKPGHHIGPAKNPDCLCDHCLNHFANLGYRCRARSVGDPPVYQPQNWKDFMKYPTTESKSNKSVPSQLYTDL